MEVIRSVRSSGATSVRGVIVLLMATASALAQEGSAKVRKVGDMVIYRDDRFYSSFPSIVRRPDGELVIAFRRALERRLRAYARPQILAIDEIGYLSYDAHAADLLFQVISRRYEQRSIVVTTNLLFKQWDTVFPNASCAVALIDRLTHHAEIIPIEPRCKRFLSATLTSMSLS